MYNQLVAVGARKGYSECMNGRARYRDFVSYVNENFDVRFCENVANYAENSTFFQFVESTSNFWHGYRIYSFLQELLLHAVEAS